MLASIPIRKPRNPCGFATNPSLIARSVMERVSAAGFKTFLSNDFSARAHGQL